MSKKNEKFRNNKLMRLLMSVIIIVIVFAMMAMVPAFQKADYEIRDNQMTIVRENKYYTNMNVIVDVIDEKGNVEREKVNIKFEDNKTNYTFDQEYFKKALETEDSVCIVDVDGNVLASFSNYTTFVSIILIIMTMVALASSLNIVMFIMGLINL